MRPIPALFAALPAVTGCVPTPDLPATPPLPGTGDSVAGAGDVNLGYVDGDATIHPDADEICNGVDADCDSTTDIDAINAGIWYADASTHPGAEDLADDDLDQDCDGADATADDNTDDTGTTKDPAECSCASADPTGPSGALVIGLLAPGVWRRRGATDPA